MMIDDNKLWAAFLLEASLQTISVKHESTKHDVLYYTKNQRMILYKEPLEAEQLRDVLIRLL